MEIICQTSICPLHLRKCVLQYTWWQFQAQGIPIYHPGLQEEQGRILGWKTTKLGYYYQQMLLIFIFSNIISKSKVCSSTNPVNYFKLDPPPPIPPKTSRSCTMPKVSLVGSMPESTRWLLLAARDDYSFWWSFICQKFTDCPIGKNLTIYPVACLRRVSHHTSKLERIREVRGDGVQWLRHLCVTFGSDSWVEKKKKKNLEGCMTVWVWYQQNNIGAYFHQ